MATEHASRGDSAANEPTCLRRFPESGPNLTGARGKIKPPDRRPAAGWPAWTDTPVGALPLDEFDEHGQPVRWGLAE
jgi:hypothetical protein